MKVLSFGEILWDVYADKKYIGGAPLNFAAHLAKHKEEVYMLSALGKDDLGEKALTQLKKWNIITDYIHLHDNKQTGKCLVTLDKNSVPTYNLLEDVAYDYIICDDALDNFDVLYFGTLSLRSNSNYKLLKDLLIRNKFKEIFVDVNIRSPFYTDKTINFSIQNATILKISLEELPTVLEAIGLENNYNYKDSAKLLAKKYENLSYILITLGADGVYALDCSTFKEYACGSHQIEVKSTVGAGDSFSAAFLHQFFRKCDIQFCIEYAAKIAGYVVSQYDAVPDYNMQDFL